MNSVILPILLISIVGTYITDYIVTHRVILKNDPNVITYSTFVKFIPSFIFMLLGYTIFSRYSGSTQLGWLIGVPLGILAHVLFVSFFYWVFPVPNVTTKPLTFLDSFGLGLVAHYFDYISAWLVVTVILYFMERNGTFCGNVSLIMPTATATTTITPNRRYSPQNRRYSPNRQPTPLF